MTKILPAHWIKPLFLLFTLLNSTLAFAADPFQALGDLSDGMGGGADEILEPDQAFQLSTRSENGQFIATWKIADGHYLYRDKTKITPTDGSNFKTGAVNKDQGELKHDEFFGEIYVYHHQAQASLPITSAKDGVKNASFKVKYQGCSEISGICYPPITKTVTLDISPFGSAVAATTGNQTMTNEPVSEQDQIAASLSSGSAILTILSFFGFGLLLAFTPCIFPMIPILSSIIVGQGKEITTGKAFTLSLVYVLAMAVTYTAAGVFAGLFGENIQAAFQNPWILGSFAGVFVLLSLSMFGFYDLQMPNFIQSRLTEVSNKQQGGSLTGVAIMGFLSALIVGPCVAAPLAGALIYIGQTGDAVLGGTALFALSMGMGAPLVAIGTSAGKLLPRAGAWMDAVKAVFGVMMLGVAIWMLERILPESITLMLWAILLIASSIYMGALEGLKAESTGWTKFWKGMGLVLFIYGILLMIGSAAGSKDMMQPLKGLAATSSHGTAQAEHLNFKNIKGIAGLNKALDAAKAENKTVMLDFYADWCVSCKEMEKFTFSDPGVQDALKNTVLLQADVTPNDELDKELYKHFGIIGPPAIIFYDTDGNEKRNYRVVGYVPAEKFSVHVKQALK
ncbi:MAG: protein-disulfide reductase DsbD [Gammaproteobacteria bacterium]|nr:protein-disulfide reductase DsbD [Gammaproteobacteria bacterium]